MRVLPVLVASAFALALGATSAAADQILGQPRIDGSSRVQLPGGPTLGRWQSHRFISTPDAVQIQGSGSTGDASGMSLAPPSGVLRAFADRADDCVNVKDRGAKADLVLDANNNRVSGTDNTAAFQNAIDRALALRKDVCVPAGAYYLASGLTMDLSSLTVDNVGRPSIRGAGRGTTLLYYGLGTFDGLTLTGGPAGTAGTHAYSTISGLRFEKVDVKGNAIKLTRTAYLQMDDYHIIGWDIGINGTDVLSSRFRNGNFRSNRIGAQFGRGTFSYPNAISFIDNNISAFQAGIVANSPTTLSILGGEIAGSGCSSQAPSSQRGGVIVNGGPMEGGVGLVVDHVYYEGNCGDADLAILSNDQAGTFTIRGNTFNRVSGTNYVTNDIKLAGSAIIKADVRANAFRRFNDYVASASRPYVETSGMTHAASVLDFSSTNLMSDPDIEGATVAEWQSFAPAFTTASGTLGSVTVNEARFKRSGKTVWVRLDVTTPTNGSGAGAWAFSLPVAPRNLSRPIFTGQNVSTGEAVIGNYLGAPAQVYIWKYNGQYPGANNARMIVESTYEAN